MTSPSNPDAAPSFQTLDKAAREVGLETRGALLADREKDATRSATWILLLGAIGGSTWPAFAASPELADGEPHPLDRWSRRVITRLAERFSAEPLFPFGGPPYQPFLAWARRAEGLSPSPLGMLIHPRHGLWHSYRGALAFSKAPADWREEAPAASPCDSCRDKPCLSGCPVGAFTADGYDVETCSNHLARPEGGACMTGGCLARRACPIAPDLAYAHDQAAFHMRAFLSARRVDATT